MKDYPISRFALVNHQRWLALQLLAASSSVRMIRWLIN